MASDVGGPALQLGSPLLQCDKVICPGEVGIDFVIVLRSRPSA